MSRWVCIEGPLGSDIYLKVDDIAAVYTEEGLTYIRLRSHKTGEGFLTQTPIAEVMALVDPDGKWDE